MIQATIYLKGKYRDGFEIKGHAEYAPYGQDIVCAAVSILAITTVNSLLDQVGQVQIKSSDDGLVSCRLVEGLDELAMIKAQAILKTLEIGLNGVQIEYPQYITLKKR